MPARRACPALSMGWVRQAHLPWAESGQPLHPPVRGTGPINVLLAANVKRAAQLLHINWDQAQHLMERALVRGCVAKGDTLPRQIGVDEKAIAKEHQHMDMALVCDLEEAMVEYIGGSHDNT